MTCDVRVSMTRDVSSFVDWLHWRPNANGAARMCRSSVRPELAQLVSWWMLWRAWVRSGGRGSAAVRVCPAMLMVMVR